LKTSTTALRDLLATRNFYAADLFTFSLVDGRVFYYSSGDRDIIANGNIYPCGGTTGPFFERVAQQNALVTWRRGLQVDSLVVDVDPGSAMIGPLPFLTACKNGLFDGAELQLERAYMPTYGDTSPGTVIMFVGRVAEIDAGRSYATFQIASHLELLNQKIPRNLYQASCVNSLFDASCGLTRAAYAVNGTVGAGSTGAQVNATLTQATGYFDLGTITFTSGLNQGLSRTIKAYTNPSTLTLIAPLPEIPQAGDTFTAWPGCDKLSSTCGAKFGNLARHRGFEFVPAAETA
jgi:uncharacterized phage protein (TIGR02218 family)